MESIAVKQCIFSDGRAAGVESLSLQDGRPCVFHAPLVIDASGRNSRLMLRPEERVAGRRGSRLYALKAHLRGVEGIGEQVELYFFPQGYGGLSLVEGGLVNLCFIANESTFQKVGGDAFRVMEETVMNNRLARQRLKRAEVVGKWHSVGPLAFGHRRLSQNGVIAIGDASGMIDPFTGTGIQIALRTGEIAAEAIIESFKEDRNKLFDETLGRYSSRYEEEFGRRMKAAGLLRIAAFSPATASFAASVLARAPGLTRRMVRATRSGKRILKPV
jgi:flavin-dependent dehydrogenase